MVPTHLLEITLLGRFAVVVGGREVPARAWGSRKAQQLVKLLALPPRHRLTIEQILDALWPDREPGEVNAAFRQTCYLVRRALDHPDLLTLRAGVLTLAAPDACLVDTLCFEQAADAARRSRRAEDYVAALNLFTGELLPEDRYADWVLAPAERLHELATILRRELAALYEQAGDGAAAEALWRRILADDPADEPSHVGLMRLYAGQGQRQRAVKQYHTLHARLHDDLALTPEPATRRLYAAILGGQYPPPAVSTPAPAAPIAPLPPHTLPTSLTTLIGREAEIATVGALLGGSARLVTLTGAGGSGKTRLALAVAEALLPGYPDGVWWVDLAALTAAALVATTVAEVLGVRPAAEQTPSAALTAALRDRTLLLVLDNAEHLRDACAELALALLRACPQVRVLVTSRVSLRVVGEQTWRVPSLAVPAAVPAAVAEITAETLAALAANDAVRLFVARARLAAAAFAITPANAVGVVAICR
ncbi:MAG TPA: BTAD domain-containing putative transcriptional regulator [Thermomicrobiales bacterium]|jgi:DNA-binding SARP family transcriptional activator